MILIIENRGMLEVGHARAHRNIGLATPIWTLSSETETRLPELDRAHVPQLRVQPEIVVPVDVVVQLGLQLAQRREALPVDELGLQHLVRRLIDRVVVRAALLRERPLDLEGVEQVVDGGVVELAASDALLSVKSNSRACAASL